MVMLQKKLLKAKYLVPSEINSSADVLLTVNLERLFRKLPHLCNIADSHWGYL